MRSKVRYWIASLTCSVVISSLARTAHTLANRRGIFLHPGARNIAVFYGRYLNVQMDPIEQRSGNSLPIPLDLKRATSAFAFQVAGKGSHPAGARIPRLSLSSEILL